MFTYFPHEAFASARGGMLSAVTILAACLAAGDGLAAPPNFPQLPAEVRATLDELLSRTDANRVYALGLSEAETQAMLAKEHKSFEELLAKLAEDVDEPSAKALAAFAGQRIELNLVHMARDHALHPQRYSTLVEHVVSGSVYGPRARKPFTVLPDKKHLTEEYRPAWERILLDPHNVERSFMNDQLRLNAATALRVIGNDASIPVLAQAFRASWCEGARLGRQALRYEGEILDALFGFVSPEALRAILDCHAFSDEVAKDAEPPKFRGHTLDELLFGYITHTGLRGKGKQWREILRQFPTENLPEKQRQLLQRALADLNQKLDKQ